MNNIIFLPALTIGAALCLIHIVSVVVVARRCRPQRTQPPPAYAASVSVIRPLCGLDNYSAETLRSTFALDYARYEILFCVANGKDPVVPLVLRLMDEHPHVRARLLIGDERISQNPKLNNIRKGWEGATGDWVVIADSNVLMPRDYVQRLLGAWQSDTGLVCSPPIGCRPDGFGAELECAFLNTYQARWQYFADSAGCGFAHGKSMLWRRDDLEAAGGLRRLGEELAEDAASTKVVRESGKRVRLHDGPFGQPLGRRGLAEVWNRQLRWARLRRDSFGVCYASEIFSTSILPIVATVTAASAAGLSPWFAAAATAVFWYGAEAALARAAGWTLSPLSPLAWILRDALMPVLWVSGWIGNGIVWRGHQMDLAVDVLLQGAVKRAD